MKKVLVLILAGIMAICLCACGGGKKTKSDEWPTSGLALRIPKPNSGVISIDLDLNDLFYVTVEKGEDDLFDVYLKECQDMGYTVEAESSTSGYDSYEAFDEEGYQLRLNSFDPGELNIYLDAPIEIGELQWPNSGISTLLPKPEASKGKIDGDSSEYFWVYVGETNKDSYKSYVDKCYDAGFSIDYTREDKYFKGKNETGHELSIEYKGFNIMYISLNAPDGETPTEEVTTTASSSTEDAKTFDISAGLDSISGLASEGESALKDKLGDLFSMFGGLLGTSESYEDIYNDYSQQIQNKTPGLIEEYKNEAASHAGDINAQAEIANKKVEVLAALSNEGVEKMAMLYYKDMDYSTYESWATKLYDVYMQYAQQIYDTYLSSAG